MKLPESFIKYKQSKIHVSIFGTGPSNLFCFHGFGQDGTSFQVLEKELGHNYTLLAIDFPFHGKTEWNEWLIMSPEDLLNILDLINLERGGDPQKKITFSILAYSLGGRIALHLLQIIPDQIEKMVLIAPDGLQVNFWYWLGTQTWAGNKLFAYTMKNPKWFFNLLNIFYKSGLLNKSIIKFVHLNIDDKNLRLTLYSRWTTMRKFKPKLSAIKQIAIQNKIPVHLVFGSYDRIILSKRGNLLKQDNDQVSVTVLDAGHELLKEKYVPVIASLLQR